MQAASFDATNPVRFLSRLFALLEAEDLDDNAAIYQRHLTSKQILEDDDAPAPPEAAKPGSAKPQ